MMEADGAADDDQPHTPGIGYLWIVSMVDLPKDKGVGKDDSSSETNDDDVPLPRYWFEVTSFCLQWRKAPRAPQDHSNRLLFSDMTQIAPLPPSTLRVTLLSSQITLKAALMDERDSWLQSLGDAVFCSGRPPGTSPGDVLTECMSNGDAAYLRHILSTNSSMVMTDDNDGNSLLLQACKMGATFDVVEALLQYGVDPQALNLEDESPLLIAAASGEPDLVRLFVESGHVDVNQRCASGITAVHAAASTGQFPCLQVLVEYGGDVMAVDERGWSVMHYAAACERGAETVTWLCQMARGLVDWPAHADGNTPLHVAARFGLDDVVYVLVHSGASLVTQNHEYETPLLVAVAHGHAHVAQLLEAFGSSHDVARGETATASPVAAYGATTPDVVEGGSAGQDGWMECLTQDGQVYFYNTHTGESAWEVPYDAPPQWATVDGAATNPTTDSTSPPPPPPGDTPLCMVPTICPLYEMDNPDVASKEFLRRKKEREQRRFGRRVSVKK
ncbi:Aste57867_21908 [Aphanomyces stellatus]|uniref:Aste57867_21908 protein n=1 Tax=Aphanomyces stellatus TaxID=120398 RepID=A0A485LJF3_9STRA|nr:hypothetical protein As57867_021839 [Aphanomyces stellatus]VFT98576.1 Aste57867_21908 [Aphanomyces stellatus]